MKMVSAAPIHTHCVAHMVRRIPVSLGDSGFPDILAKSYETVLSHTDTKDLH